jgi:hypothetical protein
MRHQLAAVIKAYAKTQEASRVLAEV